MKYMGSKRTMLMNGLGTILKAEAEQHGRVVDLFCGGGSVAWFVAQNTTRPVLAVDLQQYAVALAAAVVGRTEPLAVGNLIEGWCNKAVQRRAHDRNWREACQIEKARINTATWCKRAREMCGSALAGGLMWTAYGGHYFSPTQAITFDTLLALLPTHEPVRSVCLAAMIIAASQCAAAPGHTAQPFRPSQTASEFLREAWKREPITYVEKALNAICPMHAHITGQARVGDAVSEAANLTSRDFVFIDPPYSGVHYSRFYHVLETIARGRCGTVSGIGRYPPGAERPTSAFSRRSESIQALSKLLEGLADVGCSAIMTFPAGKCSNGLSGNIVVKTAERWFVIDKTVVRGRFSTLGGNNSHRDARHASREMILVLRPR